MYLCKLIAVLREVKYLAPQVEVARHRGLHREHPQQGQRSGDSPAEVQAEPGEDAGADEHLEGHASIQAF